MIPSYGKIYHYNDLRLKHLLNGPVVVEEKIDGWQVSFGRFDGQRWIRTKNVLSTEDDDIWEPLKPLWERLDTLDLKEDWTYRGEFLDKRCMHQICYDRAPGGNVVIWDIDRASGDYLMPLQKKTESVRLGFDCVEPLFEGVIPSIARVPSFTPLVSMLGGDVEGVVVKNYALQYNKKLLKGRFVRPEFRDS